MKRIIMNGVKNTTLWFAIILLFILVSPSVYAADRQNMFEIVDALAVGGALGCLVRWGPAAWNALKPPIHGLRAADYLVVGIGMVCIGGATRLAGQWYWRAAGKPDWWIDSAWLLYCTISITFGYYLLLIPTFTSHGGLTISTVPKILGLFLLSLGVGIVLIWAGWG